MFLDNNKNLDDKFQFTSLYKFKFKKSKNFTCKKTYSLNEIKTLMCDFIWK